MSRIAFVLVALTLAALGQQTNSALLSVQENDPSKLQANAHNEGSVSIIQSKGEVIVKTDSELKVLDITSNIDASEMSPYPIKCATGYIYDGEGCVPCPPGTYWELEKCTPCEPGTYRSLKMSLKCYPCNKYSIAPEPGSTKCEPCKKGWLSYDGITCIDPSISCKLGYVMGYGGCVPCPPGTYWQLKKCTPCKPGTYSSVEASLKCLPCTGGTIAPDFSSTYCKPCNRGWYTYDGITCVYPTSDPTKKPTPKPTSKPTYGLPIAKPTPKPSAAPTCTAGYVYGRGGCIPCPAGTYWELEKCAPCKPGTYSSTEASTKCLLCTDSGSLVAPKSGSVSCDRCDRPYYTLDGINCITNTTPTKSTTSETP